jgi:signal transduction histidine kinase
MALILVLGLVIAQILSAAIVFQDRAHLQLQTRVSRAAQRAADLVHVLDSLDTTSRARVIGAYNGARFSVTRLGSKESPLDQEPDLADESQTFADQLRQAIGGERSVSASVNYAPFDSHDNSDHSPSWLDWLARPDLVIVAQVRLDHGEFIGIRQAFPGEQKQTLYRMLIEIGIRSAIIILLLLIVVRWVTRPLSELADAAEKLGENIHRAPLEESGPAEVSRAARAFNRMQARLVAFLRERAHALAAMSHDLKTPITRLRLRTELLDDPTLRGKFEKDLIEMESMVQSTLDFMRGMDHEEKIQPIDIVAMLESLEVDFAEMGHNVEIDSQVTSPFMGRAQALKRCMQNLLANAVHYGHSARVSVSESARDLTLQVADDGPGIPEAELERVFEPFYRVEASRNRSSGGTGLGLTIARGIVQDHGGTITCRNQTSGGLLVEVVLPHSR